MESEAGRGREAVPAEGTQDGAGAADVGTDKIGEWLVALTLVAAPTHIWSLVDVKNQGVTLGILVGGAIAWLAWARRDEMPSGIRNLALGGLALGLWGLYLGVTTGEPSAWVQWSLYCFCWVVLAGGATIRLSEEGLERVTSLVSVPFLLVIVYGAYQTFARRYDWPFAFLAVTNPGHSTDPTMPGFQPGAGGEAALEYVARASSFFVEPTNFGMYLAYAFAFSLALVESPGRARVLGYLGFVLAAVGLASNQSLTALGTCSAVLAAYLGRTLLARSARRAGLVLAGIGIAIVGIALLPDALDSLLERLLKLSIEESSGRFVAIPIVIDAIAQRPLGYGFGGHAFVDSLHNGVLVLLMDLGLAGLLVPAAITTLAGVAWWSSVKADRAGRSEDAGLRVLGYALPLVHVAILFSSGLVFDPFYWSLTGMGLALPLRDEARAGM
jgi:hypothetical protein